MYRITQALSVGRFATPERATQLLAVGVTHVLNVSDAPSRVAGGEGSFREVAWFPLEDFRRFSEPTILPILDTLHRMVVEPDAHVYVHCIAGHLRSPTILWLYLIACGLEPNVAREVIESRSPDAAPGARKLVGPDLVGQVRRYGESSFVPHPRWEVLLPFEFPDE